MTRALPLLSLCALLPIGGCGEPDLEVKGTLDRVIGETVTLNLEQGENGFSGEIELIDAGAHRFNAAALKANKADERKLSFVVPSGATPGKATARVERKDGDPFRVPLDVNRLVLALDDQGAIEVLPLSPASIPTGAIGGIDALGGQISLSASGGELAVLAQDQLTLLALGATPKPVAPAIAQSGKAIVALPGGVLVCSDTALTFVSFQGGTTSQISTTLSGCKALAADRSGAKAAVLSTCDSDKDTTNEDCLTIYDIGTSITQVTNPPISLDTNPSASHVAMRPDGKAVVVADSDAVYGVWLDVTGVPNPDAEKWSQAASVVGIAMAPLGQGEIFAVADATSKQVVLYGFDKTDFKPFIGGAVALTEAPTALAFGAGTRLYVAAGTAIYTFDATQPDAPTAAGVSAASAVSTLAVQP